MFKTYLMMVVLMLLTCGVVLVSQDMSTGTITGDSTTIKGG